MNASEAIRRAQRALHEQDADGNREVIDYLDRIMPALAHIEDAKRYIDRIDAVVNPTSREHGNG